MNVSELDEQRALAFFARDDASDLVLKYEWELDSELRDDYVKLATYIECREQGVEATFAQMRACRRAPGAANVDRHFSESARHRMNNMHQLPKMLQLAHKAGVRTAGKFYVGGLGRYTDQHAWVSSADDILHVARKKNLNVSGVVKHKGTQMDPPKPIKMAPDIMQKYVQQYCAADPAVAEKVGKNPAKHLPALKEKILDKHTKKKK